MEPEQQPNVRETGKPAERMFRMILRLYFKLSISPGDELRLTRRAELFLKTGLQHAYDPYPIRR